METDQQENLIHRYLLGELPEAEQTAFEQELLTDPEKFDQVWATESRLIDRYVRGEASRAERERFEGSYLASPLHRERVAIAELFLQDIDGKTADIRQTSAAVSWWGKLFTFLQWPQPAFGVAMAMLLLLSCAAGWLYVERSRLTNQLAKLQNEAQAEHSSRRQREQELAQHAQVLEQENADRRQDNAQLQAELERLRRQQPPASSALLSFLLMSAPTRGQNAPPPSQIPQTTRPVQLMMELNGSHYSNYRFHLRTVEGREVFSQASRAHSGKDRTVATLTVPACKLVKGDYVLILSGRTAEGATEEIDRCFFQVR